MLDVFISHSTQDRNVANATLAVLEQRGIRCWMAPRDIEPGEDWGDAIVRGLDQCRAMVLVFSQHANESRYVKREVERAVAKGVLIVPFRIEDVEPKGAMALFASSVHWLDAFPPPLHDHLDKLANTLGLWLERNRPLELPVIPAASRTAESKAHADSSVSERPAPPTQVVAPRTSGRRTFAFVAAAIAATGFATHQWWKWRAGEWAIDTEPRGAVVTLGERSCVTPGTITGLPMGVYKASIALEGYEPRQVEAFIAAGQRFDSGVVKLDPHTGTLVLSSDPDGVPYEVRSATDEEAPKFTGETPDSLILPIGKYSIMMKSDGEIKTTDLEVARHAPARQSFTFAKPPPPAPSPTVTSSEPRAESPAPNLTAIVAVQPDVGTPDAGYWNLNELLANSPYSGYSEMGRRRVLYKAQCIVGENADGMAGKGTYKAIQKWQTAHALHPTGQLDSTTLTAMDLANLSDYAVWDPTRPDEAPESEKTQFRKVIERKVLGGRDLKDIFRR